MPRIVLALTTLAFLAACGAGGAPTAPSAAIGLTVTGSAEAGIAKDGS